jgi:hypothetical protein
MTSIIRIASTQLAGSITNFSTLFGMHVHFIRRFARKKPCGALLFLAGILQMEASTSPNLSQLANFDKPMMTPAAFDRCPNARSGWRAGEILNLPS